METPDGIEGLVGGLDSGVEILSCALSDLGDDLAVRGVDNAVPHV